MNAETVRATPFAIVLGLCDQQCMKDEWFRGREQMLLPKVAGKMERYVERLELSWGGIRAQRRDVERV